MSVLSKAILPLISFFTTLVLTLISSFVLHLDAKGTYLVFATGTSISLALTLIEQRIHSDLLDFRQEIIRELGQHLELHRMVKEIGDEQLEAEVTSLVRRLSSGDIPPHIAALRVPALYKSATKRVYASSACKTKDDLLRWSSSPRFRQILETSRERSRHGVKFTRTFILARLQVCKPDGTWDDDCRRTLSAQQDAGIEVRVIWLEELQVDAVMPTRRLDRNFTIFDDLEAVETTDVQVIYRRPSKRLQEIIDLSLEQIKYSDFLDLSSPQSQLVSTPLLPAVTKVVI